MGATQQGGKDTFEIGDWLVEPALDRISTAHTAVHLRPQLTELLVFLASLDGQVASLESIHDNLWPGRVVSSGTIYNCVAELRCILGNYRRNVAYVETLPKRGYRLTVPVVRLSVSEDANPGSWSIVIIPLENADGRPSTDQHCHLFADQLVLSLSQVAGLRVHLARTNNRESEYRRKVGMRFGADYVLCGGLNENDGTFCASFFLEDAAEGSTVWFRRLECPDGDFAEVLDDVADQVIDIMTHAYPASHKLVAIAPVERSYN